MIKSTVITLALLALSASAEPIKLTRGQASDLFVALATLDAGMNPANAVSAADDINALRPTVEALDKGKVAFQRSARSLAKSQAPDADEKAQALADDLALKADEPVTLELTTFLLSDEEITATKIKPSTLAVIRRWLLKPSAKPAK